MTNYLSFNPDPRTPRFVAPAGAVDAHCHIFGPGAVFPYAEGRRYTPEDAPKEALFALRDRLGLSRNVIVQAACHTTDNRAMVDALNASGGKARGVAMVEPDIDDAALDALHAAGVRGVRFHFIKRLVPATPPEVLQAIAARVVARGWHIAVYFEAKDLAELAPFITSLPGTIVVDHMARCDVTAGVEGAEFRRFVAFLDAHPDIWVKVSCPDRLTVAGPPYDDVVPLARALVERFSTRVLWGTDWPHPNFAEWMPDDGELVDLIPRIAPTAALQQALLVDNPMRLYWPEDVAGAASAG